MTRTQTVFLAVTAVVVFLFVGLYGSLVEDLGAGEVMVIQSPISGTLNWYVQPGMEWQWFGKVTKYKRRSQFWFSSKADQGQLHDESIKIRFNDGGHANISGSISWEMPVDTERLTVLHKKYGSQDAIEQELVRTVVEKAVYMTGPLMSSKESYAERRNDLLQYIEDQVQNGVYKTETQQEKIPDPMTGQLKTVNVVKLVYQDGKIIRSDASPLQDFSIRTYNPSINEIKYDATVETQIQQQQSAMMQVQTAVARAREAEQAAITAEKNGQAEAAKAKWEQEVIKAKLVTEAQQKLEVAKLGADTAEQYKREQLLRASADSEYKKQVMAADGALAQKLDALKEINRMYAEAIKNHQGSWVPTVVMGGSQNSSPAGGVFDLINLLTARTAQQLAMDMTVKGAPQADNK